MIRCTLIAASDHALITHVWLPLAPGVGAVLTSPAWGALEVVAPPWVEVPSPDRSEHLLPATFIRCRYTTEPTPMERPDAD